jgi:hypothetical protein
VVMVGGDECVYCVGVRVRGCVVLRDAVGDGAIGGESLGLERAMLGERVAQVM